jgi:hypothetical protein
MTTRLACKRCWSITSSTYIWALKLCMVKWKKYATFGMITCNNKMQPWTFSFLAVNDESIEICMWNVVWRYVMIGLWSVLLCFFLCLGRLDFCLHHNIHSSGTYLATLLLCISYFLSLVHLCTLPVTLLSQFIELCWLIVFEFLVSLQESCSLSIYVWEWEMITKC